MSVSALEIPRLNKQPLTATSYEPASVTIEPEDGILSPEDIGSLHRDDAMASAVIATVLCFAFLVLLCVTIAVNVWTTFFAS
jgi:hypothetical protein